MASLTSRRWELPGRVELSKLSRWVWLLLGLALAQVIIGSFTRDGVTVSTIVSSMLATTTLLTAAALMAVAPRQRLVALSAFGFAVVPVLQLLEFIFSHDIHDLLRMPQPTYADFSAVVMSALTTIGGLSWLFSLGAVLCLAFYIGTVRSQRGWWIVGIGLALAAVQVVINIANFLPIWSMFADAPPDSGFEPVRQLAGMILGSLVFVAWAYLTAVAFDRGLRYLALAGGIRLFEGAFSLVSAAAFQAFPVQSTDGADIMNSVWAGVFLLFGVAFSVTLILGILLELPRGNVAAPATTSATEATASGG